MSGVSKISSSQFLDLIRSRRTTPENLSEGSCNILQDAVFQLITHHQNLDTLISEGTRYSQNEERSLNGSSNHLGDHLQSGGQTTIFSIKELIRAESRNLASPLDIVAADVCAVKLLERCQNEDCNSVIGEGSSSLSECSLIIQAAHSLIEDGCFKLHHFVQSVCRNNLPLPVVWELHTSGVIPLDIYLLRRNTAPEFQDRFCDQLENFCNHDTFKQGETTLAGILSEVIQLGHSEMSCDNPDVKKISLLILDCFISRVIECIYDETPTTGQRFLNIFDILLSNRQLDIETIKAFSLHQLSHASSLHPLTALEVFSKHHQWTYGKSPSVLTSIFKRLLLFLTCNEVNQLLKTTLQQHVIGWRNTLTITSTFLLCFHDAPASFKEMLKSMLTESVESFDHHGITCLFILARHASLEGPQVFTPYKDWFYSLFGDSLRSLTNNRRSFQFLMKFLTDIVPVDQPQYLKAHIFKPPFVPPKCRELLSDYIVLAKTRLSDLKIPIESGGLTEDGENDHGSQKAKQQRLMEEVEKAVNVFGTSGKIPSSIIEASIFRKPYYLGRFLPCLLKPRPLPDKPDLKMKLIEELKRSGKLPVSTYNSYTEGCEKEKSQLLEGICIDEDSMEDTLLEPLDQLKYRLNQLMDNLDCQDLYKNPHFNEVLSHVSEKIQLVWENDSIRGDNPECWRNVKLPQIQLQVLDLLLNAICKMSIYAEINNSIANLDGFVKMLSKHSTIHPTLFSRISQLLLSEGNCLDTHHILGLSVILVLIGSARGLWEPMGLNLTASDYLDKLIGQIATHNSQCMQFSLKIFTFYLRHCFKYFSKFTVCKSDTDGVYIPNSLLKKFTYLCQRITPCGFNGDLTWNCPPEFPHSLISVSQIHSIFNSDVFKDLQKLSQLTFVEWIEEEMNVNPTADYLTETQRGLYYIHMVHDYFMPLGAEEGGCGHSYREACSQIFTALIKPRQRKYSQCFNDNCNKCLENEDSDVLPPNKQSIIILLQNLSQMVCEGDANEEGSPWLQVSMATVLKHQSEDDQLKSGLLLQEIISLIVNLNPSLLFTNSLANISTNNIIQAFSTINTTWKENLSSGLHLPYYLTTYIIQGLSVVFQFLSDKSSIPALLQQCPLILTSIMFYWDRLGYTLQTFLHVCGESVRSELLQIHDMPERLLANDFENANLNSVWLLGVTLAASCRQRNTTPSEKMLSELLGRNPQVFSVYIECLIFHLTYIQQYSQDYPEKLGNQIEVIIQQALSLQPITVLQACSQTSNSFVREHLIGQKLLKLSSVTVARFLLNLGLSQVEDLLEVIKFPLVECLLTCHVFSTQVFAEPKSPTFSQPLRLNDSYTLHSYVTHVLQQLTGQEMGKINQDLLEQCDSSVRNIVNRKLRMT